MWQLPVLYDDASAIGLQGMENVALTFSADRVTLESPSGVATGSVEIDGAVEGVLRLTIAPPDDSCSEQERLLVAETIARLGRADSDAIDTSLWIERLGQGDSRLVEESVLTFWSDDAPVIGFASR